MDSQKENPSFGDMAELVKEDFITIEEKLDETVINRIQNSVYEDEEVLSL